MLSGKGDMYGEGFLCGEKASLVRVQNKFDPFFRISSVGNYLFSHTAMKVVGGSCFFLLVGIIASAFSNNICMLMASDSTLRKQRKKGLPNFRFWGLGGGITGHFGVATRLPTPCLGGNRGGRLSSSNGDSDTMLPASCPSLCIHE